MKTLIEKSILYIFFTTGAAIVLLTAYCAITTTEINYNNVVFQILGANTIIILGLNLTKKIESSYAILEYLLDTSYTIVILIVSGLIFDWYSAVPLWYLILMGVAIYLTGVLINVVRNHNDINEINKLLKKRKEKSMNNRVV